MFPFHYCISDRFCLREVGLQKPTVLDIRQKHDPNNKNSGDVINRGGRR